MKKLNYLILGLAGLAMASCSNEDLQGPADGTYQLTVSLPKDMGTRAIGDTPTNQTLYYTLFQVDGEKTTVVDDPTGEAGVPLGEDNQATLNLPLVKGYTYQIAFFACTDAGKSVYSFSEGELSVEYDEMKYGTGVAADAYDCFAGMADLGQVSGSLSKNVELTRPVAQINWGSSDLSSPAVTSVFGSNIETELTVTVPSTLDILTGEYGTATEEVTLPAAPAPEATEEFPVTGYSYLSMQYVLATKSMTSNLTLEVSNSGNTSVTPVKVTVDNAPLQANYRTNIYGALLTDQATLNVSLATWGTPSNNISLVWDGKTKTEPVISGDNVYVQKPSDLAGLADMVNGTSGTAQNFEGMTIQISADFDMAGADFPMIGSTTRSGSSATGNSFKGVFDGQGHTISNLVITGDGNANSAPSFIANLDGSDAGLKDVIFDNITIDATGSEQAGVVGLLTNGAKVSGVTVSSGKINSKEGAGGIVGRMILSGSIEQCENYADISVTNSNGGGIVGAAYYTSPGAQMTISECHNYGNVSGTSSSAVAIGGIAGLCNADVVNCQNEGTIRGTQNSTGGIVGCQQNAGSVKGCINRGSVSSTNSTLGTGGIVGWVKYQNSSTNYPVQTVIEVSGCTNYANISGNNGVGGIVGEWYQCGICDDNKNYAETLYAQTGFVAGIVGSSQFIGDYPTYVEENQPLKVTNNTSTTTLANMNGTLKALIVYINSSANVITNGNTPEQQR